MASELDDFKYYVSYFGENAEQQAAFKEAVRVDIAQVLRPIAEVSPERQYLIGLALLHSCLECLEPVLSKDVHKLRLRNLGQNMFTLMYESLKVELQEIGVYCIEETRKS